MSNLIHAVHHIALKCRGTAQFERTVAFYRDVLGMPVVRAWGEGDGAGIMLDTGAGLMEIFASAPDAPGQGAIRHFALATSDVDACARAVKAAGYDVFTKPNDIVIASEPPFPARIAFCTGPVGEEIEFFQEK